MLNLLNKIGMLVTLYLPTTPRQSFWLRNMPFGGSFLALVVLLEEDDKSQNL
jgi:hypothetical protein